MAYRSDGCGRRVCQRLGTKTNSVLRRALAEPPGLFFRWRRGRPSVAQVEERRLREAEAGSSRLSTRTSRQYVNNRIETIRGCSATGSAHASKPWRWRFESFRPRQAPVAQRTKSSGFLPHRLRVRISPGAPRIRSSVGSERQLAKLQAEGSSPSGCPMRP